MDADGAPLDVTAWIVPNAWMVAIPGVVLALGFVMEPDRTSVRSGLQLGAALTLATAGGSRVWTLVHDRRHRDATRHWWEAHHAATRQRSLRAGLLALIALVVVLALSLSRGNYFVAATVVGPIFGALFVLAFCGESVRLRRARSRADRGGLGRG